MDYQEFKKAVVEDITKIYGEGFIVECIQISSDDVLSVYMDEQDYSVGCTLRVYYEMYQSGQSLESVLKKIEDEYGPEFS